MAYSADRGRQLWREIRHSFDPTLARSAPTTPPEPRTFAQMLSPLLQCPACDHIITYPTTLMCGHTVCSKHVLLTPTEGAASHLEPDTSDTTSPQPVHTQLPSCPILTCYAPGGPRSLRHRDTASSTSRTDDPVFPPVIYTPPPNDRQSTRLPPPPLAKVKIPHPRIDVTLQRVLGVLGRFVDLKVEAEIHTSRPVVSRRELRTRSTSRSSTISTSGIRRGVRELQLRRSSRSNSPKSMVDVVVHNVPHQPEETSVIPGAFVSGHTLNGNHPLASDTLKQEPPSKRRKNDSDSPHETNGTRSPTTSSLPLPLRSEPAVMAPIPVKVGSLKLGSELERLHPDKLVALTEAILPEVTCDVCYQLFYDPVTTLCQHTFCSNCLFRSLDYSPLCPLCREELPGYTFYHDHPSNEILLSLITTLFPSLYAARKASFLAEDGLSSQLENVPIFPCTLAFPNQPVSLNIFEPRYRLMIRRLLANGTNIFGMTMHPNPYTGEEVMYGTMLRVKRVQMHADGRSAVDTVGTWRFRIVQRRWLDGYMVANVERIDDYTPEAEAMLDTVPLGSLSLASAPTSAPSPTPPPPSTDDASSAASTPEQTSRSLPPSTAPSPAPPSRRATPSPLGPGGIERATTRELVAQCLVFIEKMRKRVAPWVAQRMDVAYGPIPEDSAQLSYWMALVLPIDDYDKGKLLSLRSPRLRLQLIAHWINALDKQSWWQNSGCVVM